MPRWNFNNDEGKYSPMAIIAVTLGGVALAALFAFLFGWLVMLLWNWLMPDIFGLPRIGYWQGWGLVLLAHILIKPNAPGGGKERKGDARRGAREEEAPRRFDAANGDARASGEARGGDGGPELDE